VSKATSGVVSLPDRFSWALTSVVADGALLDSGSCSDCSTPGVKVVAPSLPVTAG
jgi:hypothetical protein